MRAIPSRISVLDQSGKRQGYLHRADTSRLTEAECDEIIAAHLDLLADCLREAGILPDDAALRLLGTQVNKIDLLCAEISTTTDELRRLVLIEDKLLRNPQSRREVVAQLFDYAATLDTPDIQTLLEQMDDEGRAVVEEQHAELRRILVTGEFLLLVVGDDVQPRAVQLVERMARDRDPLSRTDIAIVALTMYADGERRLLLPNVVGGVVGAQRELRVTVEVTQASLPLEIKTLRVEPADPPMRLKSQAEREFFTSDAWADDDEEPDSLRKLLQSIDDAGVPGLRIVSTALGRPTIRLDDTRVGRLKVLSVLQKRRALWDSFVGADANKIGADSIASSAVDEFRRTLIAMGAESHDSGRVEIGAARVVAKPQALIDALRTLAARLRRDDKP